MPPAEERLNPDGAVSQDQYQYRAEPNKVIEIKWKDSKLRKARIGLKCNRYCCFFIQLKTKQAFASLETFCQSPSINL